MKTEPTFQQSPALGQARQQNDGGRTGACDEMLTKKELAAKLKVTVRTIENWQREGHLPFVKISSVVLFYWPEIVEHLRTNFKVCRRGVVSPRY